MDSPAIKSFLLKLRDQGIQFHDTRDGSLPPEAMMHDQGAPVPSLVISPRAQGEVETILKLLWDFNIYELLPVSVKSGGHGYFNGATCLGIMVNLAALTQRSVQDQTLILEPGCLLGHIIHILQNHRKAVPHGDCYGVGAGGHFLTAGWDTLLVRKHGLGCQSVIGGRVILWDGSVMEVNEHSHPELLYAMRGGAAAEVGIVTEIRLHLLDEPPRATWRFTRVSREQLMVCVANHAFENAFLLPRDISMSFRFHFEPDQLEPVCSFNIISLLSCDETLRHLEKHLGPLVTSLVAEPSAWNEKRLLDLRLITASDQLAENPSTLADISSTALHEEPLAYWKETLALREMARSFSASYSHWVVPQCESMLPRVYDAFSTVQNAPARERLYALVIQGGGRMMELQKDCSMLLGQALCRFEVHWSDTKDEAWSRALASSISAITEAKIDQGPGRPYRGDIWLRDQAVDTRLGAILKSYDRRFRESN